MSRAAYARRTLALLRILFLETSASHPMPIQEVLRRMEEEGCPVDRKSIYHNVSEMNETGVCIRFRPCSAGGRKGPTGYWYAGGWLDGTDPDK